MALPGHRFFLRLLMIYFLDWVVILGTIGFAGSTSLWVTPNARPFSATDPDISFPFQTKPKIPSWLLVFCSVIVPAAAIAVLSLVIPSNTQSYAQSFRTAQGWKRRLYCLNTAWLGLGLSLAAAILITDGLKNLAGRPRPDLLSRCNLDPADIDKYTVGKNNLLDWHICKNIGASGSVKGALDESDVRDGFRSFPSGHCSMSFAGLGYLSIWLAEFVFALPLPHLSTKTTPPLSAPLVDNAAEPRTSMSPATRLLSRGSQEERDTPLPRVPFMAAILVCGVPLMTAMYIASTRFSDFRHHSGDIFAGSLLGVASAVLGWRWYGAWTTSAEAEGRVYGFMRGRGRVTIERGGPGAMEMEPLPKNEEAAEAVV